MNKLTNIIQRGYDYSHQKIISKTYPLVASIEPTNACGMNCIMCPRNKMKRDVGYMEIELFEKIVKQMKANSRIVLHHMGDPLLHPKIGEMIRICYDNYIETFFSTNPASLTKHNINTILDSELDHIHISLDGATKETYEKIRGGVADYDEALNNINNFLEEIEKRESEIKVTIAIIQMQETKDEIEMFKKQWSKRQGIDEVEVKEFVTWNGSIPEITELGNKFSHKFKRKNLFPCIWSWSKITILWDGRVVPCCFDYDAKSVLGDLNKETIEDIWNGEKMQEFRKQTIEGSFPENHLCKYCREKEGFSPSKMFPLNLIFKNPLKLFKCFKYNT